MISRRTTLFWIHVCQQNKLIIDFGKACFEKDGKTYKLSSSEKQQYKMKHPQVAPDIRDGIQCQIIKCIFIWTNPSSCK